MTPNLLTNREDSAQLLRESGVFFTEKNGGAHLIVSGNGHTFDFWPGTGLWQMRGSTQRHRGVRNLMKMIAPPNVEFSGDALMNVLTGEPKQLNRCVVRLRTTMWADKSGLHMKRDLTFLRRKSEGVNVLEEDASAAGVEEVLPRILNLNGCPDGVYEVVTCNESRDYETGQVEDYDYRLVAANGKMRGENPRKGER